MTRAAKSEVLADDTSMEPSRSRFQKSRSRSWAIDIITQNPRGSFRTTPRFYVRERRAVATATGDVARVPRCGDRWAGPRLAACRPPDLSTLWALPAPRVFACVPGQPRRPERPATGWRAVLVGLRAVWLGALFGAIRARLSGICWVRRSLATRHLIQPPTVRNLLFWHN